MRDPADPDGIVGRDMSLDFGDGPGLGVHHGEVLSFDRELGYRVSFKDGDTQDFGILELRGKLTPAEVAPDATMEEEHSTAT